PAVAAPKQGAQIRAVHELEGHERRVADRAVVEHADDVRVKERGGHLRLDLEARSEARLAAEGRQDALEADARRDARLLDAVGLEGLRRPAHAEPPHDAVAPELFALLAHWVG